MWKGKKGIFPDRVFASQYRVEALCRTETLLAFHCKVEALYFAPTLGVGGTGRTVGLVLPVSAVLRPECWCSVGAVAVVGYHWSEVVIRYLVDVSGWKFQEEGEIVLEEDLSQGSYMYG